MSSQTLEGMVVEVSGVGDPVIMVHGLGGTSNTFTPQMAIFDRRYQTVRPDLAGSGRSLAQGELSIRRFADDVSALARWLGPGAAHFVGHSMGTIVCQHIAVTRPELVKSLVLLGALIEPPDAARAALRRRAQQARAEGMAEIADAIVQASTAADTKVSLPVAAAAVRESLMRQPPEGYALTCEALAEASAADATRIQCPTLLVTGEEDVVGPPDGARTLADRIGGARVVILNRCGHWPSFERAFEVNREMRHFYSQLS